MKLFFLDIDGTIAMPGYPPTQALHQAIHQLQAQGDKVFLSTGRNECFVAPEVQALGTDGGIFSAGGRVVLGGTELFSQAMPEKMTKALIASHTKAGTSFSLECAEYSYRYISPQVRQAAQAFLDSIPNANSELQRFLLDEGDGVVRFPFSDYRGEPVFKISFIATTEDSLNQVTEGTPEGAKTIRFESLLGLPMFTGETNDARCNKGVAMLHLAKHFGLSAADCIAFGDSMNDAEIVEAAGIGYAMGNADPQLKAIADRICGKCTEDGLAQALAEFVR